MEQRLKQRLVGAIVLVSLAVVFVPLLFDSPRELNEGYPATPIAEIPERPQGQSGPSVSITLEMPQTPRLDAAVERERDRQASNTGADDRRDSSEALAPASPSASSQASASTPVPGAAEPAGSVRRSDSPSARTEPAPTAGASDGASEKKPATEAPAAASGGWTVQLGSFRESENALALRKRLQARGYPAFVETGPSAQGEVSRVFVGPMARREQAEGSAEKLRREMSLEGIVVPHPGG